MNDRKTIFVVVMLAATLSACGTDELVTVPESFPKMWVPEDNALTRERFLAGIDTLRQRYPSPEAVPRPELLRGVYLVPERIEAWRGSPDRLHDRRRFAREGGEWREETLVP